MTTAHPDWPEGKRPPARIRSFTRRGDRMPESHQRAFDRFAPTHLLGLPSAHGAGSTEVDPAYQLDAAAEFGRIAPLVIEVGSGSGDALLTAARERPDWDFVAFEVWRPGVAQSMLRMADQPLDNIRFAEVDAAQALATMLPAGSVHEVWTFFPDPWPKAKHHKRRLVNPPFLDVVARLLPRGGVWRLATDWAAYADHMRIVLDADPRFALDSTDRAPLRPVTRFEDKGVRVGRTISDLTYRRT